MNDIPKIKVIDIDESEAEYSSPLKVGDEINVAAGKLTGTNYAGGTAMRINGTDATATVCKAWWDYECGWRYCAEWDGNGARTDAERRDVHVGDTVGFSEFDIAWPEA